MPDHRLKVSVTVQDLGHVETAALALFGLGHHLDADMCVDITVAPGLFPSTVVTPEQIEALTKRIADLKAARGALETAVAGTEQPKP